MSPQVFSSSCPLPGAESHLSHEYWNLPHGCHKAGRQAHQQFWLLQTPEDFNKTSYHMAWIMASQEAAVKAKWCHLAAWGFKVHWCKLQHEEKICEAEPMFSLFFLPLRDWSDAWILFSLAIQDILCQVGRSAAYRGSVPLCVWYPSFPSPLPLQIFTASKLSIIAFILASGSVF